jgi:septal ring factor EnvC (AmiA/AmiB activator)
MEMWLWNSALSIILALVGWGVRQKDRELENMTRDIEGVDKKIAALGEEVHRIQVLVNRTREEVAKEYVTKVEVHADINRVLDRLDRLDAKLDRIMNKD